MNYIRLLYLRWRCEFIEAQWIHAMQLSETYREEAETYQKEMKKAQRALFMARPVREITQ